MSGGSFNYLCYKDACDIGAYRETIIDMADAIGWYGGVEAALAAVDTRALLEEFDALQDKIDRLHKVWHAVEWEHSGDTGQGQTLMAIAEYAAARERK
jgi:hypothetical protein